MARQRHPSKYNLGQPKRQRSSNEERFILPDSMRGSPSGFRSREVTPPVVARQGRGRLLIECPEASSGRGSRANQVGEVGCPTPGPSSVVPRASRVPYDKEATPERILQLARIALVLTLLNLLCEQKNIWLSLRELFFKAFQMKYSPSNIRRVLTRMKKLSHWNQLEDLRHVKMGRNRSFIPNPFKNKLRYAKMSQQLEHPIVDHLVGWMWLCNVAKRLAEPCRLALTKVDIEERDRLAICAPIVEAFVDDDDAWAQNDIWFSNDGEKLLIGLDIQIKLMQQHLSTGWRDGFGKEKSDEVEGDAEDDESDNGDEEGSDKEVAGEQDGGNLDDDDNVTY